MGVFDEYDPIHWLKLIYSTLTEITDWITNFPKMMLLVFEYIVDEIVSVSITLFGVASDIVISVIDGIGIAMGNDPIFVLVAPVIAVGVFAAYTIFGWWFVDYAYEKIPIIG